MTYDDLKLWLGDGTPIFYRRDGRPLIWVSYRPARDAYAIEDEEGNVHRWVSGDDDPEDVMLEYVLDYPEVGSDVQVGKVIRVFEARVRALAHSRDNLLKWPFPEMDVGQANLLLPTISKLVQARPDLGLVYKKLLALGGWEVVLQSDRPEVAEALLVRGRFYGPQYSRNREMPEDAKPSRCHENAAQIWRKLKQKNARIYTGYAISEDGVWRQHSWIWLPRYRQILETTAHRIGYYGYPLNAQEAAVFAEVNG